MSKFELQEKTFDTSGVSFSESQEASKLEPSLYSRLGEDGFFELSSLFYSRVFEDSDAPWFLNIFASSSKSEAIENQYRFFVQIFGGPDLYRYVTFSSNRCKNDHIDQKFSCKSVSSRQKKGKYTRLVGRHANYSIGHRAADRWVSHMEAAMDEHSTLKDDREVREKLAKYFRYTSHYIVVASTYMRSDQLSGGTQIDPGRIW